MKNEYYVNDAGNQIKKFGISILNQMSNIKLKSKINSNEDSYKGHIYQIWHIQFKMKSKIMRLTKTK